MRASRQRRLLLRRLAPSRRSLAVGLGILAVAGGGYTIARETSIFAVDRIDVSGGSAAVDAQVRHALAPLLGRSLVGLDGNAALARVEALPTVVSATYDRAFPNTFRVTVVPEQPVAVFRQGRSGWIVSARGRVMEVAPARGANRLPHVWLPAKTPVRIGAILPDAAGGTVARALAAAGTFRARVATATLANGLLVFHLRSGVALVLGPPRGVPLKVAVASRVLPLLPAGSRYLDVTVPGRPVSGRVAPPSSVPITSSRG